MNVLKPLFTAVALFSFAAGLCAKNKPTVVSQASLLQEMTDRTELQDGTASDFVGTE